MKITCLKILLVFAPTLFSSSEAFSNENTIYFFSGEKKEFYLKDNFIIDKTCMYKKNCEVDVAIKKFLLADLSKIDKKHFVGGKNPNSVYCKHVMGGKALFGKSENGKVRLFCLMRDETILGFL